MKVMQVFDCQSMPDDVRSNFFKNTDHVGNDVYLSVDLTDFKNLSLEEYKEEYAYDGGDGGVLYLQWLLDNGATDDEVLVNHWW